LKAYGEAIALDSLLPRSTVKEVRRRVYLYCSTSILPFLGVKTSFGGIDRKRAFVAKQNSEGHGSD